MSVFKAMAATLAMCACIFVALAFGEQGRSLTLIFYYAALLLLGVGCVLRGVLRWRLGVLASAWAGFVFLVAGIISISAGTIPDTDLIPMVAGISGVSWFGGIGIGEIGRVLGTGVKFGR